MPLAVNYRLTRVSSNWEKASTTWTLNWEAVTGWVLNSILQISCYVISWYFSPHYFKGNPKHDNDQAAIWRETRPRAWDPAAIGVIIPRSLFREPRSFLHLSWPDWRHSVQDEQQQVFRLQLLRQEQQTAGQLHYQVGIALGHSWHRRFARCMSLISITGSIFVP